MKKIALLTSLAILFLHNSSQAQLITQFSPVKTVTQKGDITFASNAITQCTGSGATCTNGRNQVPPGGNTHNGTTGITIGYIDQDGSTGIGAQTFSSSSANLNMDGIGGCGVVYAYLTWGGFVSTATTNYAKRDSVYLQVPGGTTYSKLKADFFVDNTAPYNRTYHCYKDVTNIVKVAGPGTYMAGNIVALTGANNQFGGWSLVVIYADNSKPLRNLTIFRGLAGVSGTSTVQFPISGFFTPPAPAPVNVRLGIIAFDGDRALPNTTGTGAGDSLKFNGVPVSNGKNPQDDIFNSTITNNNTEIVRVPSYTNTFGYDADIFNLANGTYAYLANSASSAILRMSSGGETILTDIVTTAIDVFEPEIRLEKGYNNLNRSNALPAQPGDIIEFLITASNKGSDPADSLIVIDSLYGAAIYVPNSMSITQGANTGVKTDAVGDDQMDFDPVTNVVRARLGINANGVNGGKLLNVGASDSISTFKFRVQISNNCEFFRCSDSLYNMAFSTYKGQTSQGYRTLYSSASGTDVNGCPLTGAVRVKVDIDLGNCPLPNDTAFTTCRPYNLSNVQAFRPGYNTYFNSGGTQVTQATTNGIYYAVKTIYSGFSWLPACKDTVVLNLNLPCILPIVLIDFKAKYINKKIELTWKTAQEINNKYFEIERSIDGFSFEKIATVQAAINGNTATNYSYEDVNYPAKNIIYYRLAYVDVNGIRKYTEIRTVKIDQDYNDNLYINFAYPNPAKSTVSFSINAIQQTIVYIRMISMEGKTVITKIITLRKGDNILTLDISNLPGGMYLVDLADSITGKKTTTKILKK